MRLFTFRLLLLLISANFINLYSQTSENADGMSDSVYVYDYQLELKKIDEKPKFGLFINYGSNNYKTDFKSLPNYASCCSNFETGNGFGLEFGGSAEFVINNLFSYGFRLSLANLSGELKKNDAFPVIINSQYVDGITENNIDIAYYLFTLNPYFSYKITPISKYLQSYVGLKAGIPVSATFSQYEKIIEPDQGTFNDGKRIRNVQSGDLPNKNSFMAGLTVGLGYEIPINKHNSLRLTPEFYYTYWFTSPVKDLSWQVSQFIAGIAIKYIAPPAPAPAPADPILPNLPALPLPKVEEQFFAVNITAHTLEADNDSTSSNVNITLEDFTHVNLKPLLNYIFFDENSSEIPLRYKLLNRGYADKFAIKNLQGLDIMGTYYNVLNIVGLRMQQYSASIVTLTGNNSNTDMEKNNITLSEERANSIKNYLVDVWRIPENRIQLKAQNLPKDPTRSIEPGADDENRRVEIVSNDSRITESILSFDTVRIVKSTDILLKPSVNSTFGIKNWEINIAQEDINLATWSGNSNDLPEAINWNVSNDHYANLKDTDIEYSLAVSDEIGQIKASPKGKININRITIDAKRREMHSDMEYEYYSLILFDFGAKKLEKEHKQVVDFVKSRVKSNSNVTISGYTDYIGDEVVNGKIATDRARAVAKRLNIAGADVRGIGEAELLYDNSTPEGRFYCRTVTIAIETPINN